MHDKRRHQCVAEGWILLHFHEVFQTKSFTNGINFHCHLCILVSLTGLLRRVLGELLGPEYVAAP